MYPICVQQIKIIHVCIFNIFTFYIHNQFLNDCEIWSSVYQPVTHRSSSLALLESKALFTLGKFFRNSLLCRTKHLKIKHTREMDNCSGISIFVKISPV